MNWIEYFWTILKSALFSTGGLGPLPILHDDFITRGWAGEKQFTEALAIGQITPGPSGLWVISFGYLAAGLTGAVLACIALLLPPLIILIVQRGHARIAGLPATQGFLDGIVLVITSFNLIVLVRMFWSNGLNLGLVAIAVISAILAISRKVSANVILVAAILIGLIWN